MTDTTPRVVFDTNVFISTFIAPTSIPAQAFQLGFLECVVLCSEATAAEFKEVVLREKFNRYRPDLNRTAYVEALLQACLPVKVVSEIKLSDDPKDDKFLELAADGNADFLVSGDDHLLQLHMFRGIPIITPLEFLQRLGG